MKLIANRMEEIEKLKFGDLEFSVISSEDLRELNRIHLGHDYATDILTFDLSEGKKKDALILISCEDVEENSRRFRTETENEFLRVAIHGLLHLSGYDDLTQHQKRTMKKKENEYLNYALNAGKGN